jgi:hypothetical protein
MPTTVETETTPSGMRFWIDVHDPEAGVETGVPLLQAAKGVPPLQAAKGVPPLQAAKGVSDGRLLHGLVGGPWTAWYAASPADRCLTRAQVCVVCVCLAFASYVACTGIFYTWWVHELWW